MERLYINKPIGKTPAECCKELREKLKVQNIAFACRLDPMAYGLMPMIIGEGKDVSEACKFYNDCDKVYTFKLIMGLASDTYDILGIIKRRQDTILDESKTQILDLDIIRSLTEDEYPPYSSKTATDPQTGKKECLWKLTSEGKVPKDVPKRKIEIKSIDVTVEKTYTSKDLYKKIVKRINLVSKSQKLRQDQAIESWKEVLGVEGFDEVKEKFKGGSSSEELFKVYKIRADVTSGTYIRSLGDKLGGVCYDICRKRIGTINIETHKYKLSH